MQCIEYWCWSVPPLQMKRLLLWNSNLSFQDYWHGVSDLPRQQWSLLNRFLTEQGHCGACRRKWRLTDTDLCPCGETHTISHIVESCPLTKLNGGLSRLHSADEDAVSWLTSYGSCNAYEKKKTDTLAWSVRGCDCSFEFARIAPCGQCQIFFCPGSPQISCYVLVC